MTYYDRPEIIFDQPSGTLYGQFGRITDPRVGYMRDNVFLGATFGWEGSGSGVGSVADFTFDAYDKDREERIPSVAFGYWIRDVMKTMGVTSWDQLKGLPVVCLWDNKTGLGGFCKGIFNPDNDEILIWDEWWDNVGRPLMNAEEESR